MMSYYRHGRTLWYLSREEIGKVWASSMASCQVPIGMTASATKRWNGKDLGIPNGTGAQSYSCLENKYLRGRGCCFRNFSTGEHGFYSVGLQIWDRNNTVKIPKDVNDIMNEIDEAVSSHRFEGLMNLIHKAEQILKPLAKERPKLAAHVYDSMIKACAASAKASVQEHAPGNSISNSPAHKAFHLVGSMWRQGIPVGRVAQGSLIKSLCDAGYARKAFKHLKTIPKSRLHPSFFNIILDACIHSGELDLGKEAAQRCLRYNDIPDALTWSLILKLHGMLGDRGGVELAWASLLDICPWTTNGDGNIFQKELFDESNSESFRKCSHTISYHDKEVGKYMVNEAYVQSLVASGDLETAYSACNAILDMATGQYLPLPLEISNSAFQTRSSNEDDVDIMRLDAVIKHIRNACNIILHASECQHNWNTMKNLVGSMATHGLPPDTRSYNYLLWASYRRGEGTRILEEGLEEMKALGLIPNADSYELMMEASLKYNAPSMAKEYLHECMKNTTRGQGWAWGSILKAHGKVGDLPGLLNSFNEMIEALVEDSEHIRTRKTLRGLEGCLVGLKLATELLLEDIENLYIHSLAGASKRIIESSNELINDNKQPHVKEETSRDRIIMLGRLAEAMSLYSTQNQNNKSNAGVIVSPRHLQEIKMARTMLRRVTSDLYGGIDSLKTSSLADLISIHGNLGDLKDVLKILQHQYRFNAEVPCSTGSADLCDQESSMISLLSNRNSSKNDHWQKSPGATYPSLKPDPRIIDAAVGAFGKMNRWDLVLSTLQWMASFGIYPTAKLSATIIEACPWSKTEFAHNIIECINEKKIGGADVTRAFNAFLRMKYFVDGAEAVESVLNDMKEANVAPNIVTWNMVNSIGIQKGRNDLIERARFGLDDIHGCEVGSETPEINHGGSKMEDKDEHHWQSGFYAIAAEEEDEW